MIVFLVKVSVVLAVLYGFYKLFLQKESFFAANRLYLMASLVLAFSLPFVTLPELIDYQGFVDKVFSESDVATMNIPIEEESPEPVLQESIGFKSEISTIIIPSEGTPNLNMTYWLGLLYFFVASILLLNLLKQLMGVLSKIVKSKIRTRDGRLNIIDPIRETEPCSFFNYIFMNIDRYDRDTYTQILEHEKTHVKKWHSVDLLLSELAIIILWFNPLVWLYRKEVEKNIEYQTDALMLKSQVVVAEDYQMSLLSIASYKKSNTLASNLSAGQAGYNQSLIKKRIVMMNKQKSNRHNYWKYAFLAPTLFVILVLLNRPYTLNAQENIDSDFHGEEGYSEEYSHHNDHSGDLPLLHKASADGDEFKVKSILSKGSDVNEIAHGDGTALYLALQHDHWDLAKVLLENGANPNVGSSADGYPILLAVMIKDPELVQLLVDYGAKVDIDFPGDGNAMIQAAKNGDLNMVMKLLDLKVDINRGVINRLAI